jgi:hypothetical protein
LPNVRKGKENDILSSFCLFNYLDSFSLVAQLAMCKHEGKEMILN